MRCNWRRWLWGLIPLVMVSWVAVQVERGRIEQDLSERAGKALANIGAEWASIVFSGRDAELSGRAIQDTQPPEAEQAVRSVWGIRAVDNKASLPPKVEPFLWSARRRGNRIRLAGFVPNRATRQTIIGMINAALPGFDVVDRTKVARGVPPADTWLAGLSFALKQLASLKQGTVRFEDLALAISGEAEDAAGYRAVSAALKSGLPKGITLASAQITAPIASPFTWSAQFAGGQLVLSGHVAGEGAKSDLLAAAATSPGTNVVDRMEPAEGAPQGWATVAVAVVKELTRLQSGNADTKDAALTVSGVAADEAQAQSVRAALRSALPANFKLNDQIRLREAAVKAPEPAPKAEPAPAAAEPQAPVTPEPKMTDAAPQPQPKQPEPVPAPKQPDAPPQPVPTPAQPSAAKQAEPPKQADPPVKQAEPAPAAVPKPAEPEPKVAIATPAPAPPTPAAVALCQQNLSKIAGTGQILFDSDSATISPASFGTLNKLATAAKHCPGVRIAIEGHADIEGSTEYNQRLSVRRAEAVVEYLVKAGAAAEQLEAVGFGATRPVAPNNSLLNKARNRRIQFIVRRP